MPSRWLLSTRATASSRNRKSLRREDPPTLLWLFAPFALLPPRPAFAVWTLVQAASLGVVLWLTVWLVGPRLSRRGRWFVAAAAVASNSVFAHFFFSQVQLLLAATVLGAYAWHRAGRHTAACLAITTAGLI